MNSADMPYSNALVVPDVADNQPARGMPARPASPVVAGSARIAKRSSPSRVPVRSIMVADMTILSRRLTPSTLLTKHCQIDASCCQVLPTAGQRLVPGKFLDCPSDCRYADGTRCKGVVDLPSSARCPAPPCQPPLPSVPRAPPRASPGPLFAASSALPVVTAALTG